MKKLGFKYVYHSHTERCGHSNGSDEQFVLSAIKQGVKILCFTDHDPIPNFSQPRIRMDLEKLEDYIKSINYLKEKYKDKIEIHVALEAENFPGHNDFLKDYLKKGIEYLIIGQHMVMINEKIVWLMNEQFTKEQVIDAYVNSIIDALESGLTKYVAHPDLIVSAFGEYSPEIDAGLRRIVECAVKHDAYLEVNCHGLTYLGDDEFAYPNKYFWTMVKKDYPNAKITLGLDIHNLDEYENNVWAPKAIKRAKDVGIKLTNRIDVEKELK